MTAELGTGKIDDHATGWWLPPTTATSEPTWTYVAVKSSMREYDARLSERSADVLALFESVEFFPATGEVRLRMLTGEVFSALDSPVPDTVIVRSCWGLSGTNVELEFDDGNVVVLDVATRPLVPDPRPVVYLDQNHWVELARARVGSPKLTGDRLETYLQFSQLVESGDIIVPLSSAHLTEMSRKGGQQRRDVAVTMLRLSRGWQMRNPLRVRHEELRTVFDERVTVAPVFTLEPDVIWTHEPPPRPPIPEGDVRALTLALANRVAAAASLADVLADPERLESDEGLDLAARWAASFEDLARHVRTNPKAKAHLRLVSLARFITDMQEDLAQAARDSGMTTAAFQHWLMNDSEQALMQLPAAGRIREVTHQRLANADDKWERNDLYDMLHLSTAAGYADFVVGERKIGNYLRRASANTRPGGQVFVKMADALTAIETELAERHAVSDDRNGSTNHHRLDSDDRVGCDS